MSHVLTVPTHFEDLAELSEGFVDRVEQDTVILYGPVPYEEGEEIEFAVLLADGSTALEGSGRVRAAVDGGEERVPETRYDTVVEALHFVGHYEVIFEKLVAERQRVSEHPYEDEPATGTQEAVAEQEAAQDQPAEEIEVASANDEPHADMNGHSVDEDMMEAISEPQEAVADDSLAETKPGIPMPSAAPPPLDLPDPPSLTVEHGPDGLTRPSHARGQAQEPDADAMSVAEDMDMDIDAPVEAAPEQSAGLFQYGNDLPIPSQPPHPAAEETHDSGRPEEGVSEDV